VLEHLDPVDGEFFLSEQLRVLRPGGVCRVVVPDLERLCRDYLEHLQNAKDDPAGVLKYRWTVMFLIDQLVREDCGGEMLRAFRRRDFDPEFTRSRIGDEAAPFLVPTSPMDLPSVVSAHRSFISRLKPLLKRVMGRDARGRGEAHRWMYDSLSLRLLLTKVGFTDYQVVTHAESRIPQWDDFLLDTSKGGVGPRKPDSLFAEALKPRPLS
jgi:SAM-dependent methyltransferase